MRRFLVFAVAALISLPLAAANLGMYNTWTDSPASYFMTKAERAQWAQLTSEADAEKFVADFYARRDAGFKAEVNKRAEMADKYLTIGKTPGSKTFRGKLVILFGPPSAVDATLKSQAARTTGSMAMGPVGSEDSGSIGGGGTTVADAASVAERDVMNAASTLRVYTFTFPGANLPTKTDAKFAVEVNMANEKERLEDKKQNALFESLADQIAQASIKK